MKTKIVSIDFQKDFSAEGGKCYQPRPSVDFVKNTLAPFLEKKQVKIAEIISDYRLPRTEGRRNTCVPGGWGYESEIPMSTKESDIWIKCMNSPVWIRENIGDPAQSPGLPYQDTKKFDEWISRVIGKPNEVEIVLIGLTLDCCVLCTAQEFNFRGFRVKILKEATDAYSGNQEEKNILCRSPLKNWATAISWEEFQQLFDH